MTFRRLNPVVAPLVFGAAFLGVLALGSTQPTLRFSFVVVVPGIVSLILTSIAYRFEAADPAWWRAHGRHCLLVYPWLLLALASQGEGITKDLGPFLFWPIVSVAVVNAGVLALRTTSEMRPNQRL